MITSLVENKGERRILDMDITLFSEIIDELNLVYIVTKNSALTWNNKRLGGHHVISHLDQFLKLYSIMDLRSDISMLFLPSIGSDHWHVSLF